MNIYEVFEKTKEVVNGLSLEQKVFLLSGVKLSIGDLLHLFGYGKYRPFLTLPVKNSNLPGIKFIDGPRGVTFKGSTAFPVAVVRGATWNPELEEKVGEVMGYEARAGGANFSGAVCINILRHPSWGRAQETYGEDPFHVGEMATGLIRGLQKHVMACAKHFACNSIENSRFYVSVRIDERSLREVYLPHFKKCVEAGVDSIMCAYNKVNGEYCCQNRHLLTEILKEEWNFSGFVISDFIWGVRDTVKTINAGVDLEMPYPIHFGKKLLKAVRSGRVSEGRIDDAVKRLISKQLEFLERSKNAVYYKKKVASSDHTRIALQVAREGMVLLKNNGILPINTERITNIAIIGRYADKPNLGDKGSSSVSPPFVITPCMGITDLVGGQINVTCYDGKRLTKVENLARKSDLVIVVIGADWLIITLVLRLILTQAERKGR